MSLGFVNCESKASRKKKGLGLAGRKIGMTRIFMQDGKSVPVTVLLVANNRVAQVKTPETDGYTAVQLAFGAARRSRVNRAQAGHFAKAAIEAGTVLKEFRLDAAQVAELTAGQVIDINTVFHVGQQVSVQGTSKGKGFAGTIKRHNFASGRASHGNSRAHNVPGSIGQCQDPGRVFPGKRMSGHMGAELVTVDGLEVMEIDSNRGLLFVKGAVPGAPNQIIFVEPSFKARTEKGAD